MDYRKIYNQLVERAKLRNIDGYVERHHIIPKSMGGDNSKENMVALTAREHFLAHWLLWRIHRNSSTASAFWYMSARFTFSSRAYNEAKEALHEAGVSDETRKKLSQYRLGKKYSEQTRKNMATAKQNLAKEGFCFARGKCYIHNVDGLTKLIKVDKLDEFINSGWIKGGIGKKENCKGYVHVHKNNLNKFVKPDCVDELIRDGWILGRAVDFDFAVQKGKVIVNKEGKIRYIEKEKLEEFYKDGWKKGRKNQRLSGDTKDSPNAL